MSQRLPSLNVLNVFDAAARHLSFKQAADELCISPPAVSHQVRVLEEQLGVLLFKRLNRALELTPDGKTYHLEIHEALQKLHAATNRLLKKQPDTAFRISSIPFLTNSLLVPNIQKFRENHPELRINIQSQTQRVDFGLGEVDVAIRHKRGEEAELHYEELSTIYISPVCTPDYLETHNTLTNKELKDHCLIRLSVDQHAWPFWLKTWNQGLEPENELSLDNYQAILDAVKQGMGVAMGYRPFLNPLLKTGELVSPYPDQVSEYNRIYLVYPQKQVNNPNIESFQRWLKSLFQTLYSDK